MSGGWPPGIKGRQSTTFLPITSSKLKQQSRAHPYARNIYRLQLKWTINHYYSSSLLDIAWLHGKSRKTASLQSLSSISASIEPVAALQTTASKTNMQNVKLSHNTVHKRHVRSSALLSPNISHTFKSIDYVKNATAYFSAESVSKSAAAHASQ